MAASALCFLGLAQLPLCHSQTIIATATATTAMWWSCLSPKFVAYREDGRGCREKPGRLGLAWGPADRYALS